MHSAAVLCQGMGSGLSAAVHQGDAVLGGGTSAPCAAAAGRGSAPDADRWAASRRVSVEEDASLTLK